jgi:pSer/pThr/pTyr-binding forkhead associated (FHA) protein
MNELSLTIIRVAFLAVLWLFVIAAIGVVRTDLLGGPASNGRRGKLRQTQAPRPGRPQKPAKPARAGRGSARILVVTAGDDYASSRHARIFPQDGQWIVEDLGSTNGTYLDRQKVTRPMPVPVGVPIRIGKTVLELRR